MPYKDPEKRRASGQERARRWREANAELFAFIVQRSDAKKRGIAFLLSFEDWLAIWQASGKLDQRGRHPGQYCMARFGDAGPYAVNNVHICLHEENLAERKPYNVAQRRKMGEASKAWWASMTPSEKAEFSARREAQTRHRRPAFLTSKRIFPNAQG